MVLGKSWRQQPCLEEKTARCRQGTAATGEQEKGNEREVLVRCRKHNENLRRANRVMLVEPTSFLVVLSDRRDRDMFKAIGAYKQTSGGWRERNEALLPNTSKVNYLVCLDTGVSASGIT